MSNKITSIIAVLLLISPAFSLVQFNKCDEPCCQPEISCCQIATMVSCESSMTTCDTPLLIPIVVAPVNKVVQQVDITIVVINELHAARISDQYFYQSKFDQTVAPEPPTSFLIPLLI